MKNEGLKIIDLEGNSPETVKTSRRNIPVQSEQAVHEISD